MTPRGATSQDMEAAYDAAAQPGGARLLIDDFTGPPLTSRLGMRWRVVTDRVMGGVSDADLTPAGAGAGLRMRGDVSLDNDGGFVQMSLDLALGEGEVLDASGFDGVEVTVRGNGEIYGVHLRTDRLARPWQSYRQSFRAGPDWHSIRLPFAGFQPHRTEAVFEPARLKRIGFVAIGRAFTADLAISKLALYRAAPDEGGQVGAGS